MSARLFWDPGLDKSAVTVRAEAAVAEDPEAFDIKRLNVRRGYLRLEGGGEEAELREGMRRIRLSVRTGTLLEGPVRLSFELSGLASLETKMIPLARLGSLWRRGHFPRHHLRAGNRARRWIMILRTIDALAEGARQREIAEALFGTALSAAEWRAESDFLRLRVQRLARLSLELTEGGYRRLLAG